VRLVPCVVALLAAGCAHPVPVYRPAGLGGELIPTYDLPSASPTGTLRVLSFGGERLPVGPFGPDVHLHVRLSAVNERDSRLWILDPNDQVLVFNGSTVPPSYSRTSGAEPVLKLSRGERGYLDVYYPLPDVDPSRVTLAWRVHRGGEVLGELTSFDRVSGRRDPEFADREVYDSGASFGMGLGWFWPEYCWRWHGAYLAPYIPRRGGPIWSSGSSSSETYSSNDRTTNSNDFSHRTWVPPAGEDHSSSAPPPSVGSDSGGGASGPSSDDAAKSSWRGGGHH
jgi:hypothetical protein